ncbi:MAG: hypothetical protein WBS22_05410 [Methylocystis sp.]
MSRRPVISVFAALSGLILSVSVGLAQQKTAPSAAPSTPAPTTAPAEPSAPAGTPAAAAPSGSSAGAPSGELQFETAGQARSHCPGDTVVWANLASKVYHFYGERRYGSTRRGAYMCETDAKAAGMKPKKNEKHP